jgi:xylulokinase
MLLLGIDLGTSSIKVSVVNADTQQCIASTNYPETETEIIAVQACWAEQSPELWWEHVQQAIIKLNSTRTYNPKDIAAIGIAYQMHGLVMVDKNQKVLRNSIIWCDSRAVEIGNAAFEKIGNEKCLSHLLNSPGNFTASKLAWVKQNEPEIYAKADKIMLPGDFIAMKLTGEITTTIAALSEGMFWDFKNNQLSKDVVDYFGFDTALIPTIKNVFETHGQLLPNVAAHLSLKQGIAITYKAGDQPNNALSLNVLQPGEVAATAGTSGVIYAVSDKLGFDKQSRVNSFAHLNHNNQKNNIGVLLCVNGCGIMNRYAKENFGAGLSYSDMNARAATIQAGSNGLHIFPFGNGAERMLNNKIIGASFNNLNVNIHTAAHIFRAVQEGIAYALRYGLDIMRSNNIHPTVIKAGFANMFLSKTFTNAFVNATGVPVELYNNDGSVGAAIGAGIGVGIFKNAEEAFQNIKPIKLIEPTTAEQYNDLYQHWYQQLQTQLS